MGTMPEVLRRKTRVLCALAFAVLVLPFVPGAACPTEMDFKPPSGSTQQLLTSLTPIEYSGTLGLFERAEFEVDVPAGHLLHVAIGASQPGGLLELVRLEAPDGSVYRGLTGLISDDAHTFSNVSGPKDGRGATRVAFTASGREGGTWRFVIERGAVGDLAELGESTKQRSVLENALLWAYILNNLNATSTQLDGYAQFLRLLYPQLEAGRGRIIYLMLAAVAPPNQDVDVELPPDFGEPNENDDSSGGNTNGNGNSNANDNGGASDNGNTNGNTNSNTNTNDNGNTNTNDNGNSNDNGDSNGNDNGNTNGNTNDNGNAVPTRVDFDQIVASGDPVPEQPTNAAFTRFGDPIIDDSGRVAFWASFMGGNGDAGLYVWQSGELTRVVDDNPDRLGEVPGRGGNDRFGDFNVNEQGTSPQMAWGSNGRLIFIAGSRGSSRSSGIYRWRASDGDLLRVADMAFASTAFPNVASGSNGPVFSSIFFQPGVSDGGIVPFVMSYSFATTGGGFGVGTGAFTSNAATMTVLADQTLASFRDVPDQSGATFSDFDGLTTLNAPGEFLFQARYAGGNGDRGVYLRSGSSLVRVIDNGTGRAFPGLPLGAVVGAAGQAFDALALGNEGHIVIETTITQNAQTRNTVILWNGTTWRELGSTTGATADLLVTGVNNAGRCVVVADGRPRLVDGGTTNVDLSLSTPPQFAGRTLAWGGAGGAINNAGRALISLTAGGQSEPALVFWTGAQLLLVADGASNVPTMGVFDARIVGFPELNRVGRSGALSDTDIMVFRVRRVGADGSRNTADDTQAIYLGTAK